MSPILGPDGEEALARLSACHCLLAFDFDGTLAPIVPDRDMAAMRPGTRQRLGALCRDYPCAVISGRGLEDVRSRVQGLGLRHVIGGHGLQPSEEFDRYEAYADQAAGLLAPRLRGIKGLELERKPGCLSIHYRHAPDARAAIEAAVASVRVPMRAFGGHLVLNLVPEGAPHKGHALQRLMLEEGAEAALYVGDDETDEDVFRLTSGTRLISIRVGPSDSTAASWYLEQQEHVDDLLERLTRLRAGLPSAIDHGRPGPEPAAE